ncbi:MAG: hypothetical protein HQK65_00235 [Desulfamplus sp.]|nr:hypothetical protein [Desulfamplus sp.]
MSQDDSSRFKRAFGRSRVFLPVIHPISEEIALKSIETAIKAGADGIFLINQGMSTYEVLALIPEVHLRYKSLWIGINLLGSAPEEVIGLVADLPVSGIWSDNADIDEKSNRQEQPAGKRFQEAREKIGWHGIYFGGVAFKYQRKIPETLLPAAARNASPWMDVITSSGAGTGYAASVEKAKDLRAGAGRHPLCLASGISSDNVTGFLPYVNCFIVATSIEIDFGVLSEEKTKLLCDIIHKWSDK